MQSYSALKEMKKQFKWFSKDRGIICPVHTPPYSTEGFQGNLESPYISEIEDCLYDIVLSQYQTL